MQRHFFFLRNARIAHAATISVFVFLCPCISVRVCLTSAHNRTRRDIFNPNNSCRCIKSRDGNNSLNASIATGNFANASIATNHNAHTNTCVIFA